jgi:hypothetical protein
MLFDTSWIADGKPWPPEDADENARLAEHARMRNVYNGLHDVVFPAYSAYLADLTKDPKKQKIILDWPELATTSYINLLLGEEPEVVTTRDDLPERHDDQVFIDCSRYGFGLYEVSDAGIQALNPENCYLILTLDNIQLPQAFVFFHVFKKIEGDGDKKKEIEYVKFTIHSTGKIQHVVYEVASNQTVSNIPGINLTVTATSVSKTLKGPKNLKDFPEFAYLDVDSTGAQSPSVDDILIVMVNNQLSSERYYGRSDYKPSVLSLIESLEKLFAQRAEVLAKFVSPTPVIPESATVFDHKNKEWTYRPGQPIIMGPGDQSPSLMVWDAQLANVTVAIDQSMDQLLQMLQLSKVLLAGKDAGAAESGTALRIRLIPTLAKVSKYARAAEIAIPKVINLWSQLHPPTVEIPDITINLQDGIPEDPMETAQTAQFWDAMGAMSLERKLVLQGLEEGSDAFNTELERLKGQQQQEVAQIPTLSLPALPPLEGA